MEGSKKTETHLSDPWWEDLSAAVCFYLDSGRIQKVDPPILDSSTPMGYITNYRTLRWIYFLDPPRGLAHKRCSDCFGGAVWSHGVSGQVRRP